MTSLIKDFYLETWTPDPELFLEAQESAMVRVQHIPSRLTDALLPTPERLLSHLLLHALYHPDAAYLPALHGKILHWLCTSLILQLTCDPRCCSCCLSRLKLPPSSPWLPRYIGTHSNQNAGLGSAVVRLQREEESLWWVREWEFWCWEGNCNDIQ